MTVITNHGTMPAADAAHIMLKEGNSANSFFNQEVENLLTAIILDMSNGCDFEVSKRNIEAVASQVNRFVAEGKFTEFDEISEDNPAYHAWAAFACSNNKENIALQLKLQINGLLA